MPNFFSHGLHARSIAVFVAAVLSSAYPTHSAESLPETGARSTKVPAAVSVAATVIAASARPGRFFGAQVLATADTVAAKASVEGKSPAPIVVIRGLNGLTISSDDLDALDEFERLLSAAANGSGKGPMAVFTSSTPKPKRSHKSSKPYSPMGRWIPKFLPIRDRQAVGWPPARSRLRRSLG